MSRVATFQKINPPSVYYYYSLGVIHFLSSLINRKCLKVEKVSIVTCQPKEATAFPLYKVYSETKWGKEGWKIL